MSSVPLLAVEIAWFAVLASGILAGLHLGTAMASHTARSLPEMSWTLRHQSEDALFRRVMPPFMIFTLLLLAGAAGLSRGAASAWFAAGAIVTLLVIVLAVTQQVPLNREIASWIPGDAPPEWMAIRDKWVFRHSVRSAVAIVAFACAAAGLLRLLVDGVRF